MAVYGSPIDLHLIASFRHTTLTASLDGYLDDSFFAGITLAGEFILVCQDAFKSSLEVNPEIARRQDKVGSCV